MKRKIMILLLLAAVVLGFTVSVSRLEADRHQEDKQLLADVLHRTAAACYASEGFYPPDVAYMQQYYGLRYDESRYLVRYERFASNLMPDITVLDMAYEE